MQHFNNQNLENLIKRAIEEGASDIHLSSGNFGALRVQGELDYVQDFGKFSREDLEQFASEILNEKQLDKFNRTGDLDFAYTYETQRFRGSLYREMLGVSMTFRLIPSVIKTLDELGLPPVLKEIAEKHRGLFLTTGPTGHGKSSTLAALVSEINNNRRCHIVTIEDPIEYIHKPELSIIHQREVGSDTENFASGIRHVLRQDPDVILIGEMRDLETISAAVTAAETGHLVLGTLHTQDASQSIERIVDVFPPHQQNQIRLQLAYTLIGICSQQLLPAAGFRGRFCATEILLTAPAVRSNIREGKTGNLRNVMLTGSGAGMHTMEQDLVRLFKAGSISKTTARSYAYDQPEIERLLNI